MTAREQYDMLYTLAISLASGTVGLASYLQRTDVWVALMVAVLCGFAGGYAKAAGAAMWTRTTRWWEKRQASKTSKQ